MVFSSRNQHVRALAADTVSAPDAVMGTIGEGIYWPPRPRRSGQKVAGVRAIVEGAGASADDIIKVTAWIQDRGDGTALNRLFTVEGVVEV